MPVLPQTILSEVQTSLDSAHLAFGGEENPNRSVESQEEIHELQQRYASLLIHLDRLRPMLAATDVLQRSEAPQEWSIKEILGHIIDTDRDIWWPRIHAMLESDLPYFTNIDQDELVQRHQWQSLPIDDVFAQLMRVRWNYAMELGQLPIAAFSRCGEHPALGEITMLHILDILIAHDAHYIEKIESLIAKTGK